MRLDKFIAQQLGVSRAIAGREIRGNRVTVDGEIVRNSAFKLLPEHDVEYDGNSLTQQNGPRYFMLNKPEGFVTATEDKTEKTVLDLLPTELKRLKLFPVGRLDKDTTGLLILTNDGEFCHTVTSPKKHISKLYEFDGLNKVEVKEATIGSIVAISGIADIHIGDTLCGGENPEAIPFQKISEPTIAMNFIVNDSPLAGQEGKYITSRHLRDRLYRELNTDVSLRVEDTETTEAFKVSGRGELHLSVLIENMRREGYEFAVSKPEVLYKTDERGKKLEPMEIAYVDVPEEFSGTVIQKLSERKGELQGMSTASDGTVRLEFHIPSRGLIGFRGEFLTSTKGTGIINTMFDGYAPYKGDFQYRKQGSLIAFEAGEAVTYGLFAAQERGTLFIGPGAKVYSGMVIGQNGKAEDIELREIELVRLKFLSDVAN